ncbi:hypothetical protein [Nocardia altamirensis]|uniref:hypothetical protein n=1 Tax=Nocardia altamirensis TaxID=472158 RepID=UPI00083FF513|nr:hypothetical protein [Nocardia altamirensis]
MLNTASPSSVLDVDAGLLDLRTASIGYGYYTENVSAVDAFTRDRRRARSGPTGWWNRHRGLRLGVGLAMTVNIGLLPAAQDALLSMVPHLT